MIVIPAASNDPAQAVVVEQAVEAEAVLAVMASKMGLDTSLPRTERLLILKKQLTKQYLCSNNDVNARKEGDVDVST